MSVAEGRAEVLAIEPARTGDRWARVDARWSFGFEGIGVAADERFDDRAKGGSRGLEGLVGAKRDEGESGHPFCAGSYADWSAVLSFVL